jgi:hypothetical protein
MNHMLIDNALLAAAFITAIVVTRYTKERKAGAVSSFFLLFAPLIVFLNMWAHTVAVLVVNIQRHLAGRFHYSFTFYGLILFGVVFIVVSGYQIHCARLRIMGDANQRSAILKLNALTSVFFLPVVFINPISLLPVLAAIVSTVTVLCMKSSRSTVRYDREKKAGSIWQKWDSKQYPLPKV